MTLNTLEFQVQSNLEKAVRLAKQQSGTFVEIWLPSSCGLTLLTLTFLYCCAAPKLSHGPRACSDLKRAKVRTDVTQMQPPEVPPLDVPSTADIGVSHSNKETQSRSEVQNAAKKGFFLTNDILLSYDILFAAQSLICCLAIMLLKQHSRWELT